MLTHELLINNQILKLATASIAPKISIPYYLKRNKVPIIHRDFVGFKYERICSVTLNFFREFIKRAFTIFS